MKKYNYQFACPATSSDEATQKMKALAHLAGLLDGKTLEALSNKVPTILSDPETSGLVKNFLGI